MLSIIIIMPTWCCIFFKHQMTSSASWASVKSYPQGRPTAARCQGFHLPRRGCLCSSASLMKPGELLENVLQVD